MRKHAFNEARCSATNNMRMSMRLPSCVSEPNLSARTNLQLQSDRASTRNLRNVFGLRHWLGNQAGVKTASNGGWWAYTIR